MYDSLKWPKDFFFASQLTTCKSEALQNSLLSTSEPNEITTQIDYFSNTQQQRCFFGTCYLILSQQQDIYVFKLHAKKKEKKNRKACEKWNSRPKKKHKAMVSFDFQMSPLVWWRKKEMWTKFISKGSSTSFGNSLTLCIRVLPCFLAYSCWTHL